MGVSFDSPAFLLLLALVPVVWLTSFRSLAGLGPVRRVAVLGLRGTIVALLILAASETQWVQTSERLTVLYLLDQSTSIPQPQRKLMADYVNESVAKHRDARTGDRAGVIVFAKEAAVEYPPVEETIQLAPKLETTLDTAHTNLAGALKLALAVLPADSANRVVVVTDGNENLGNAFQEARQLAEHGIGIDVVPIRYAPRSEVAVEKLDVPSEVHAGQPFNLRVVLNNTAPDHADAKPATGKLHVFRKTREAETEISSQAVEFPPGKQVLSMSEKIDAADAYTYSARFVPDDPTTDTLQQNKEATAFTQVRGQGRVLVIEDSEAPGEFDLLIDRLRKDKLQVTVINTNDLFTSLGQLQPYDTVILANVPREEFSNAQIQMLVANTQQLGAGLIMLGGPNSFGAGGWAKTELEAALPVDCEVKNQKVRPIGALALVIDRSGSMRGDKLAGAQAAAIAAANVLSDNDYLTVTAFDVNPLLVVPITKKNATNTIEARINRLSADGGTDMRQAVVMAHDQLTKATDAGTRHMVILTDGLSNGSGYAELAAQFRKDKITVSTVALGDDADARLLSAMAHAGGGNFYQSKNSRVLPRIFQQEARIVSRPLVFERKGLQPQIKFPHEILKGIDAAPPAIDGFVLTSLKESPLVEVALQSPLPVEEQYRTLLATWSYGLGKVVAFTTDAGRRWSNSWSTWPNYDKLFSQMVRWSMRPSGDQGKFSVATDVRGDKVQVVVNALNKDDEFLNFLNPAGSVVGPSMKPVDLKLQQTAPGRYVGEFTATDPGSYFMTIATLPGAAPIMAGVDVPYSPEYLDRESNEGLLTALANITPVGSEPGVLIQTPGTSTATDLAATNVFRHNLRPATSRQDAWPQLLLLASCLFFCDVFVRRVQFDFGWATKLATNARDRLLRREPVPVVETLARLQKRKSAVAQAIASQNAATQFAPLPSEPTLPGPSADESTVANEAKLAADQAVAADLEPESHTSRLLKIKQQFRDDRSS
jgi:Mg-chelatase subunit ChlD